MTIHCGAALRLGVTFALALSGALLSAQRAPIAEQLSFAPYRASGIYDVGDTVGWTVTPGATPPSYAYKWTIRRNNAVVLNEGRLDLSNGKAAIEIVGDQPSMIYVAIEAYEELAPASAPPAGESRRFVGGNAGRNTGFYAVGAAVAPAKIGLSTPRPPDFDAFWDAKLAAQTKVPIDPVLTPVDSRVPGVEMSVFTLDALGSTAFLLRQVLGRRAVRVSVPLAADYELDDPGAVDRLDAAAAAFAGNSLGAVRQPDGTDEDLRAWLDRYWYSP